MVSTGTALPFGEVEETLRVKDVLTAAYLRGNHPEAFKGETFSSGRKVWLFDNTKIPQTDEPTLRLSEIPALLERLGLEIRDRNASAARPAAPSAAKGQRTKFTDEMKREALALRDRGLNMSQVQKELEKKFGGPAYQTLVKFFSDRK